MLINDFFCVMTKGYYRPIPPITIEIGKVKTFSIQSCDKVTNT